MPRLASGCLRDVDNLETRLAVQVDQLAGQRFAQDGHWLRKLETTVGHPADAQCLFLDTDNHHLVPSCTIHVADLHMSSVLESRESGAQIESAGGTLPEDDHPGTRRIRYHHVHSTVTVHIAGRHVPK